jgi:hypothetical protein
MRIGLLLGLGTTVALLTATAQDARACGGCFHEPSPTQSGTVVTDHRMIFAVSPQKTTLYDQVKYSGAPSSFAWVLPIHGPVTVGLSADVLFGALDQATQTTILAPQLPPCPPPPFAGGGFPGGGGGGFAVPANAPPPPVTVLSQAVVGPYETVQLQSTSANALGAWLSANGYTIPSSVQPVIAAYVAEGFDFLAMRLLPGKGVQAMRPVSVTSTGAGLSLPLRMVAAGTGATVGITLWVVSSGRYDPQNFPTFTVSASDLFWDWSPSVNSSNYTTVRAQKEAALKNAAWQIESSLDISSYQVENAVLQGPADAAYLAVPALDGGSGGGKTADQVRQDDLATVFPAAGTSVRITRMRADLSQAALANDLVLQASSDQSVMSNLYQVTQSVNAPACPGSIAPMCPQPGPSCPGGGGSGGTLLPFGSGGSGSGGGIMIGTGSGGAGASSGGTSKPASPGQGAFGCSTSPIDPGGAAFDLGLAGLVGFSLVRARARSRRNRP